MSKTLDIEALCYALILLEEICQGYDTGRYRFRAQTFIQQSGVELPGLGRWLMRVLSTPEFIDQVENVLETYTAPETAAEK